MKEQKHFPEEMKITFSWGRRWLLHCVKEERLTIKKWRVNYFPAEKTNTKYKKIKYIVYVF